jgi:hypothetical protein
VAVRSFSSSLEDMRNPMRPSVGESEVRMVGSEYGGGAGLRFQCSKFEAGPPNLWTRDTLTCTRRNSDVTCSCERADGSYVVLNTRSTPTKIILLNAGKYSSATHFDDHIERSLPPTRSTATNAIQCTGSITLSKLLARGTTINEQAQAITMRTKHSAGPILHEE